MATNDDTNKYSGTIMLSNSWRIVQIGITKRKYIRSTRKMGLQGKINICCVCNHTGIIASQISGHMIVVQAKIKVTNGQQFAGLSLSWCHQVCLTAWPEVCIQICFIKKTSVLLVSKTELNGPACNNVLEIYMKYMGKNVIQICKNSFKMIWNEILVWVIEKWTLAYWKPISAYIKWVTALNCEM